VGRVLAVDNRIKLLFLATSSAGAARTTRTAKLRELKHDHRVEDAGLALAALRQCGQRVGFNRALWEALT
jgi:nucleoside-triphosphatase THEP1